MFDIKVLFSPSRSLFPDFGLKSQPVSDTLRAICETFSSALYYMRQYTKWKRKYTLVHSMMEEGKECISTWQAGPLPFPTHASILVIIQQSLDRTKVDLGSSV